MVYIIGSLGPHKIHLGSTDHTDFMSGLPLFTEGPIGIEDNSESSLIFFTSKSSMISIKYRRHIGHSSENIPTMVGHSIQN